MMCAKICINRIYNIFLPANLYIVNLVFLIYGYVGQPITVMLLFCVKKNYIILT